MQKLILIIATICLIAACGDSATEKQTTGDSSASSSADSIKNAVENSLKDTVLNPTDTVRSVDSVRK